MRIFNSCVMCSLARFDPCKPGCAPASYELLCRTLSLISSDILTWSADSLDSVQ